MKELCSLVWDEDIIPTTFRSTLSNWKTYKIMRRQTLLESMKKIVNS